MEPYQLNIPTRVYFGREIWREALKAQEGFLRGRVMVVTTGRSLWRLGYLDSLRGQLGSLPYVKGITIFDHISANPKLTEVREGIRLGKEEKTDVVVGFGGGSAIDAAKAVAAGIRAEEDIGEIFYGGKEPKGVLPVVAIPTTAGTGSELSKAAILTDGEKKIKNGIRGEALYPKVAVVDSVFTESVPLRTTMETGFDVLAHAIESYFSRAASPYTQMQSEYVIQKAGSCLLRLAGCLEDKKARESMSFASMLMGINLGNAGTCLPHRLQYPLGAHTDTSHGAGLAALFPAWFCHEYRQEPERAEQVLKLLTGQDICGEEACTSAIRRFLSDIRLSVSLQKLGVKEEQLCWMAEEVTGNIKGDPASQEEGVILKIYREAWQEGE